MCSVFLLVMNAPMLNSDIKNKEEYVAFADQIAHAFLPDRNENPELHELVTLYQLQRHSKACRKYKNKFAKFVNLSLENFLLRKH